jgi:CRP-like cAMP-binding protein
LVISQSTRHRGAPTLETVIRLLSEFKDERLIAIKGRNIYLLDPARLKAIATMSG